MSLLVTLPVAFAAGALTILSPCVLPLAPIVIAGGRAQGFWGPAALAGGLAATFGIGGGALAAFGVEFGDSEVLRRISASLMIAVGVFLLIPRASTWLEARLHGVSAFADRLEAASPRAGLWGQAATGGVLAFAWAPCAGPTLGSAFVLAAQGGSPAAAMGVMTVYALGAAGALLALGFALGRLAHRGKRLAANVGRAGRWVFGASFVLIGAAVFSGLDHRIEAVLTDAMPDWLARVAGAL